jgi:hypothetical protein
MKGSSDPKIVLRGLHHCRTESCFDCPYRPLKGAGKCKSELMGDARTMIINLREAGQRG